MGIKRKVGKVIEKVTISRLRESIMEKIPKNRIILDNGCGLTGSWDYGDQKDIHSVDLLWGDDATDLPYEKNYFDMVVFSGVIQYIEDYEKAISEMTRVLRPHGLMLITTINRESLLRKMGLITKKPKFTEKQLFTIKELEKLIKDNNYKIIDKWGVSFMSMPMSLCSNMCYLCKTRKKKEVR